jgi:hypothetical protein
MIYLQPQKCDIFGSKNKWEEELKNMLLRPDSSFFHGDIEGKHCRKP